MENGCCIMKIIAIANAAGGVGKSTLAHALAVAFTEFGKKTLLIDLDPAGALTFRLGFENPRISITDFLSGTILNDSNVATTDERFDFIPADARLTAILPEDSMANVISKFPKSYDLVILDLPSSLSQPLALALSVSDLFLVPVRNNVHSLRGYQQIKSVVTKQLLKAVAIGENNFLSAQELLDESITDSQEVERAATTKVSILTHVKTSEVAQSYRSAAYSILELLELE
jgi:cellulose biosynthesis protein BcsQ